MRAVRRRSSIREVELVCEVACPPSSPDLFLRPRRRMPAMLDSILRVDVERKEAPLNTAPKAKRVVMSYARGVLPLLGGLFWDLFCHMIP